ncbi:MAG: hypothetical protein ACKVX9_22610 [Blastocatellia bacterium]
MSQAHWSKAAQTVAMRGGERRENSDGKYARISLLARINKGLPAEDRARMRALIEKRDDETITSEEWQEFAALTDRLELLHADRLAALVELAKLRGCFEI